MTPAFFDGPISMQYRDILEAESLLQAAPSPKAGTGGTKCKSEPVIICPQPGTAGTKCKSLPKVCGKKKLGTGGTKCKSEPNICPKAGAIPPSVPGWSLPPAP